MRKKNKIKIWRKILIPRSKPNIFAAVFSLCRWSSPFVIFAGKSTVDEFADGCRVVNIIQDHDQRYFCCADVPIDLIGQVGQIKLQILRTEIFQGKRIKTWHTK